MLEIRTRRTSSTMQVRLANSKLKLASSLTALLILSSLNLSASAAPPSSKVLTPEQLKQRRDQYIQFQRSVQYQFQRQEQISLQQKQQRELKLQQELAQQQQQSSSGKSPLVKFAKQQTPIPREDVLLVMPAQGAKPDDVRASIENANGEICGGLGAAGLKVILVKARPGKVVELQRKLAADTTNFLHVDFNRKVKAEFIPTTEPTFPKSWHLTRLNVPDAWDIVFQHGSFPMPVAVFDSGTQGPEPFIAGAGADCTGTVGNKKVNDLGFDFNGFLGTGLFADSIKDQEADIATIGNNIKTVTYGCTDTFGHGTWVSSTIDGSPYNGKGSAGLNPMVPIYPIRVANGAPGTTIYADDLSLVKAMCVMYDTLNTRIINISYGDMMSAKDHPILHEFFKDWYNRKNGLIFVSAGNNGENLSMANQPYVLCVSAMAQLDGMHIVDATNASWASGTGTAVDFTAPGQNIQVCNPDGTSKSVNGTSFSSPICAAIASMIWTINPNLKNTQVQQIMIDSCENTGNANWNPKFGWGMPDALKACQEAQRTLSK
ncbi:MAG TPA: S8/S53 family peptidase [Oculatellaceae cyanobacterium]